MRTYPNYLLFLIVNSLLISSIRQDPPPSFVKFITFTQSLLSPHPSFFGEAWSLAVEEIFYLIIPVILSFFIFLTNNKKISISLTFLSLILIPLFLRIHAAFYTEMTFNEIRSTALYRLDSITLGFMSLIIFKKIGSNRLFKIGALLVTLCLFISAKPE